MTVKYIGFTPEPKMSWGLYHYRCECPACDWFSQSDKGMYQPELAFERHWQRHHNKNNPNYIPLDYPNWL